MYKTEGKAEWKKTECIKQKSKTSVNKNKWVEGKETDKSEYWKSQENRSVKKQDESFTAKQNIPEETKSQTVVHVWVGHL